MKIEVEIDWQGLRSVRKSEIFWAVILLIALVLLGIFFTPGLFYVWGVGSLYTIIELLDIDSERGRLWQLLMPITWLILIVGFSYIGLVWVFEKTIGRFNNYLDNL
jgi:hypothetical protein